MLQLPSYDHDPKVPIPSMPFRVDLDKAYDTKRNWSPDPECDLYKSAQDFKEFPIGPNVIFDDDKVHPDFHRLVFYYHLRDIHICGIATHKYLIFKPGEKKRNTDGKKFGLCRVVTARKNENGKLKPMPKVKPQWVAKHAESKDHSTSDASESEDDGWFQVQV